jgi:hypothetical protein
VARFTWGSWLHKRNPGAEDEPHGDLGILTGATLSQLRFPLMADIDSLRHDLIHVGARNFAKLTKSLGH